MTFAEWKRAVDVGLRSGQRGFTTDEIDVAEMETAFEAGESPVAFAKTAQRSPTRTAALQAPSCGTELMALVLAAFAGYVAQIAGMALSSAFDVSAVVFMALLTLTTMLAGACGAAVLVAMHPQRVLYAGIAYLVQGSGFLFVWLGVLASMGGITKETMGSAWWLFLWQALAATVVLLLLPRAKKRVRNFAPVVLFVAEMVAILLIGITRGR